MCQVLHFSHRQLVLGTYVWLLKISIDNRRVAEDGWNITLTTQEAVYTDLCFTSKAEYCIIVQLCPIYHA